MQMLFQNFYRMYGVRRPQQLIAPRIGYISALPFSSMYHYLSDEEDHPDVDTSKIFLAAARKVVIDYPVELDTTLGNPQQRTINVRSFIRGWQGSNKKFRYVPEPHVKINDRNTLFVENYSYIGHRTKYMGLPLAPYYKWFNEHAQIYTQISRVNAVQRLNHFVNIDIPQTLPSLVMLKMFAKKMTPQALKVFDSSAKLYILELMKLIESGTEGTIFAGLKESDYASINFILSLKDGRSSVVNLSYLLGWMKGHDAAEDQASADFEPLTLQKLMLKYLIVLNSTNTEEVSSAVPEITAPVVDPDEELDDDEDLEPQAQSTQEKDLQINSSQSGNPSEVFSEVSDQDLMAAMSSDVDLESHLQDVDAELKVLEVLQNKKLSDQGLKIDENGELIEHSNIPELDAGTLKTMVNVARETNDILLEQIEAHAEQGALSAAEYRRLMKDAMAYDESADPYGIGESVAQRRVIKPEELLLDQDKVKIATTHLVQDEGMKESSLLSYDKDYINKVIKKDTLAMIHSVQKAGVIIKGHEIEVEHSALGSYELHTLDLKPVDGAASRVHIRVPVVNEDGTFTANGSKYSLRKQRCDLPIRKINPYTVSLTSYYGKTFVTVSQKKANNSLDWIDRELQKALDGEEHFILQVNAASLFDNNFPAPYIYNALADKYGSIVTKDFTLMFDYRERHKWIKDLDLASLEKGGSIVTGYSSKGDPIIVNKDNQFFIINAKGEIPLGDVYQLFHLPATRCPVDFTEVRIFSKSVPVMLVLGYAIGWKNTLKLLGATYRTVEARKQILLEPHEYVVKFSDMTYIFTRKQPVAALVISGILEYDKEIKRYESTEFNSKDVYLNLMSARGLNSMYIREIDCIQQLFVDSITQGILEEMGEPTTFNGLLLRASEMLLTYHHPDSQDMAAMRIRGYERIPGAMYKELAMAIRGFRNKNIGGRSKIDMSPYQVWTTIVKDTSIKMVEDINPIHNLKEQEIVTYSGEGGRGRDSMNKDSRAYHGNDIGVISEATVDSSDVGVNAYTSANPQFSSLRGLSKPQKAMNGTSRMSTSANLIAGADRDDQSVTS